MSFSDSNKTSDDDRTEVVLCDEPTGRQANVIQRSDGNNALATDATVTVEQLFGRDPLPDTFFTITAAGAIGDTVRVQVAATTADSTSPDRDLAAVDLTYTLVAADVGDEVQLADNIVSYLNAQAAWDNAYLKADRVGGDLRAIIHVTSTEFAMSGEFAERPNAGDFSVTPSGTTTVNVGFDNIIARGKATSLARDPDNPHRLGVLGISGSVTVTPGAIADLFIEFAENASYTPPRDMLQDGSSTPIDFQVINTDTDHDVFIDILRFSAVASSIKFQQFLAIPTLSNGITVSIKSEDETKTLTARPIVNSEDFLDLFDFGGTEGNIVSQPSSHHLKASWVFENPFPLRASGTYSSDEYIKVTINDDLTSTSLSQLEMVVKGFQKEV